MHLEYLELSNSWAFRYIEVSIPVGLPNNLMPVIPVTPYIGWRLIVTTRFFLFGSPVYPARCSVADFLLNWIVDPSSLNTLTWPMSWEIPVWQQKDETKNMNVGSRKHAGHGPILGFWPWGARCWTWSLIRLYRGFANPSMARWYIAISGDAGCFLYLVTGMSRPWPCITIPCQPAASWRLAAASKPSLKAPFYVN